MVIFASVRSRKITRKTEEEFCNILTMANLVWLWENNNKNDSWSENISKYTYITIDYSTV